MRLRCISWGREEASGDTRWNFYWGHEILTVSLSMVRSDTRSGRPGWIHWKLEEMDLPFNLEDKREEILTALKEALTVYKDGGIYSMSTDFKVILDV